MNSTKNNKFIFYSLILGFLGFLDSTYLTVLHYKNIIPPCSILHGCEKVLNSSFSTIGPIPLALFGAFFYLLVITVCLVIITENKKELIQVFYLFVGIGFVVSVSLFLIQALIIKAFCQFCVLSEVISTGLLILAFLKFRQDSPSGEAGKKVK